MCDVQPDPAGLETYEVVLGKASSKRLRGIREHTINHLFAKVWRNEKLSIRDRRLITIALLAAQGHRDQLKSHIQGALTSDPEAGGLSEVEILELMVQVAHYAGWAAGTSGHEAALEVLYGPS